MLSFVLSDFWNFTSWYSPNGQVPGSSNQMDSALIIKGPDPALPRLVTCLNFPETVQQSTAGPGWQDSL